MQLYAQQFAMFIIRRKTSTLILLTIQTRWTETSNRMIEKQNDCNLKREYLWINYLLLA
jgi:hypothetical protein